MKIGYFGINFGLAADPDPMIELARAAEAAGLESVWTGEHVVLPDPQAPPSPSPPRTPFIDPAVALGYVAANTERIRLGTGIIILPQRNPLVLAKELASVDVLSKGRLIFGLGAGYLHQEFAALGAPFEDRGAVTDEAIAAIKALWTMDQPRFEGEHFSFSGIDAQPRPVQKPHPPIVIGGMSRSAARRAATAGNGWYGFRTDLDKTAAMVRSIGELAAAEGRPDSLGAIEYSVTPPKRLDADLVRRYEDLGVHRLIALSQARTVGDTLRDIEALGELAS
jgi:probable F420-dependent oxidoreductase